jgi:hypothetical protein
MYLIYLSLPGRAFAAFNSVNALFKCVSEAVLGRLSEELLSREEGGMWGLCFPVHPNL